MAAPHAYPHRALVAASGMSPQIITETLYAIAVNQQPAVVPTEIHILTTIEGRTKIEAGLLGKPDGHLRKLVEDYRLDPAMLDRIHIHVVKRAGAQQELNDIIDADDNAGFANLAVEVIRGLSERPDLAMHVSLAGGRKTMSYYTGYALSMFGRPQDSLSHVLVPPECEQCNTFYYPTVDSIIMMPRKSEFNPDPRPFDAALSKVSLANIPFIRMRDILVAALPQTVRTFDETVVEISRRSSADLLIIDVSRRKVWLGEKPVKLEKRWLEIYAWFAWRKKSGKGPVLLKGKKEDPEYAQEFMQFCAENIDDGFGSTGSRCEKLGYDADRRPLPPEVLKSRNLSSPGMSVLFLTEAQSRIRAALRKEKWLKSAALYGVNNTYKKKGYPILDIGLEARYIVLKGLNGKWSVE